MAYLIIVDDDEEFAGAATLVLRREGHEVASATDSAAALAKMKERAPDLVILDVMFPEDDFAGFDLARAMHGCSNLSRIPILMLTGVNRRFAVDFSTFDIDNSWLPVTDFVNKPVDFGVLTAKITALLATAAAGSGTSPVGSQKNRPASSGK